MSLHELLSTLQLLDIELSVTDGQLRVASPASTLTPALRLQLRHYKPEIIEFLQRVDSRNKPVLQGTKRQSDTPPLSYAQQRLWFLDEMGSGSAYNMPIALQVRGRLNMPILQAVLNEIVRRHESLRTNFAVNLSGESSPEGEATENEQEVGAPYQVIQPAAQLVVPVVDLSDLSPTQQAASVQERAEREALRPFDLSKDLMLRAQVLKLATESNVLLLTMHHIASDGWSIGILVQELSALYAAFSQGEPSPLPELTIQYADFAVWQRRYLQGEVLEKQVKWWKEQLADAPALLQLPTDRPRPTQQSFRGSLVRGEIEATLTQRLHELSRRQGATLYMTLLAAFQILLHRYSGQDDIVVGSPIANRNRAELEPLIGFFVNTLALRSNLADNPSFLELLTHVQQTTQAAYDHQDLPFERLVEELHPERNLAYTPVVQVMFALQNAAMGDFELPGLRVSALEFAVQTTRVDLELHVREVGDSLQLYAVYSSDLFDASTIERLVAHYQELLKGIVANPAQAIATLPLLTEAERHQLLVEWNNTASDYPKDKTIHQLFEEQVERTPDAVAVVMAGEQGLETRGQRLSAVESPVSSLQSLTYAELNARANQLAHHLRSLGVAPDVLVGICVERSIEMVVGFLGILKAGGAYVPLDPTYPLERLAFMLQDTAVSVLLTQSHLLDRLPGTTAQVVCLDQNAPMIQEFSTSTPKVAMGSENLAYVIYTSGSTGQPKGVMIQHNNVANLITWHQTVYQLTTNDHTTQVATPAFDAVVWEVWPTLTAGATLHIMDDSTRGEPSQLLQWLSNHAITVSFLPTPLAEVVLNERCADALSLRLLLTGGDMLRYWPTSDIPFTVVNNYGPTENTVVTTWAALTSEHIQGKLPPIGRPVFNTQVYLLDRKLQPVPIGVSGELYIGGASLARCYHNRPELTDEKFIPNSFGLGKLYKTGDLARWLPDGNIEFLGRIDQQVKLRGFRIELGEIEAVLSQHPDVHEAVVVVREEQANNQQLVAYLVADGADAVVQSEHLTTWQSLYESSYSQAAAKEELNLNLTGWNSSYTGQPIAKAEMVEWVEQTVAEIRTLQPQRVLEIGCGTGLLLARLAPTCTAYWGVDYSRQAIAHVQRLQQATPALSHVQLAQRMADDLSGFAAGSFDCVILNSVVQYFPSVDYLLQVLEAAVHKVQAGGVVYVGDVRNYRLLEAYHASVQLHQANDDLLFSGLQARIQQRMQDEEELLIDPAFFLALPQHLPEIKRVQVQAKRGEAHNELTRFRYQVVLHIGDKQAHEIQTSLPSYPETSWHKTGGTLATLRILLHAENIANGFVVRNIPNARLQQEAYTLQALSENRLTTVAQLRQQLSQLPSAIEPEALWRLGEELGCSVQVMDAAEVGKMDALFSRQRADLPLGSSFLPPPTHKPWRHYTNNPLLGKLHRTLIPQVRSFLQSKLPDYMIPNAFVLLDKFPLTPNGKIDRKALPAPHSLNRASDQPFVAPRTDTERALAGIWRGLLGLEKISIHDNFFDLGGHSLLATQVVSRVRTDLVVDLSLRTFFSLPTISEIAESIDNSQLNGTDEAILTQMLNEIESLSSKN